ncbi:MAG: ATP-binding protein, partial [Ignavibacteriaceae bacterium]
TSFYATIFIVCIAIIVQIYLLIKYIENTNKEISRFFYSIRYSDFTQNFKSKIKGAGFEELNNSFAEVIEEFKKARSEKEENFHYLQIIVQHINIGILAYTIDGNVELINNATKKLLGINSLRNISELKGKSEPLVKTLIEMRAGKKALVKIVDNNELIQLSIFAAEFKLRDKYIILVSLNNIQSELEEKEMEAWQNLIRVLTHEIMNSITPIVSLSSTVNNMLENSDKMLTEEDIEEFKAAVGTIEKRSKGLIHFVDDYRNLNRVPIPQFQIFKISLLFERIKNLLHEQLAEKNISFVSAVEPDNLEIMIDPDLIEQVLINLILNSINAFDGIPNPGIKLLGIIDNRGMINIQVIDNGKGIPEDLQEKIFIPFFTTKKEGSGIGLSLSKQIMKAHKGGISVKSQVNNGTTITLKFT